MEWMVGPTGPEVLVAQGLQGLGGGRLVGCWWGEGRGLRSWFVSARHVEGLSEQVEVSSARIVADPYVENSQLSSMTEYSP